MSWDLFGCSFLRIGLVKLDVSWWNRNRKYGHFFPLVKWTFGHKGRWGPFGLHSGAGQRSHDFLLIAKKNILIQCIDFIIFLMIYKPSVYKFHTVWSRPMWIKVKRRWQILPQPQITFLRGPVLGLKGGISIDADSAPHTMSHIIIHYSDWP